MVPQPAAQVWHAGNSSVYADHEALVFRFHPYSVRSHASGQYPAPGGTSPFCFPDSSPKSSLGPCSRMHGLALGSRASRSGFAKG